jgi:hypothetical protein
MTMTQLRCEGCEANLHGRDIDFSSGIAMCRLCGAQVEKSTRKRAGHKRVVPLPTSVDVKEGPDGAGGIALNIRVPWRVQGASAAGELASLLVIGSAGVASSQLEMPWFVTLLIVALVIGVFVLVRTVNSTIITVARGQINVRHSPLPWLSHALDAGSIAQLYVDRRPVAQKRFDYNLRAQLHDDDQVILLLRSLKESMVALYLEQVLEGHLHIVDREVQGEYQHRYSQHQPMPAGAQLGAQAPLAQPPPPPQAGPPGSPPAY